MRRIREVHDARLDISVLKDLVGGAFETVAADKQQVGRWCELKLSESALSKWVDGDVSDRWGKLAAFRVLHICRTGRDAEFAEPFEAAPPSAKQVSLLDAVPGSPQQATNLYDVSQALSWVASHRRNAEEKSEWQKAIPALLGKLDGRAMAQALG